jgi:hypothetical protein
VASTGAATSGSSTGAGGPSSGASSAGSADSGSTSGGGSGAASSGSSAGGSTAVSPDGGRCADACPAPKAGIAFGCAKRFLLGVNYAWKNWVADFGGVAARGGVSGNQAAIKADLQDMQSQGVDVIRWWMLQQLSGDAVTFDSNGNPTGAGGTLVADIQAALDLAAQVGVHYNLTLFSFDDFKASSTVAGATLHGMSPIATDATKRAALMGVVKTIAQTVEASPHKDRVVSWDVINEPEWVITGSDPYGDPAFSTNTKYEAVTFAQMETFVADVVQTLHANSSALTTVGGAAIKWAQAWTHVGIDYYTFHMYDWVNRYYPYDKSLASYGVTGKPAVLGEFPLAGLAAVNGKPAVALGTMLGALMNTGYAGAMPWARDDTCCGNWATTKGDIGAFAMANPCATHF